MRAAKRRDDYFLRLIDTSNMEPLTDAERKQIEEFWRPYSFAYENNPDVQWVLSRMSGRFDPSYIGFGLQRWSLVRFWNSRFYEHLPLKYNLWKNFPMVSHPETCLSRQSGYYVSGDTHSLISHDEAVDIVAQAINAKGELIIKPAALDAGEGKNIIFVDESSISSLPEILQDFGSDYVVQEVLKNHPSFAAPHPGSLQTLRIVTMCYKEEVRLIATILRMATSGRVDNWSQGGFACAVNRDGTLNEFACDEHGHRIARHPGGLIFKGHKLYKASECMDKALEMHATVPFQKFIAWDITVTDSGDIVLIEINSPGDTGLVECVGFNPYGDIETAKEIFDEYFIRRFYYLRACFDWDYREFNDHVSLVKYGGMESAVVVPEAIEGKPVQMLYANAFDSCDLSSVMIPESIHCDIAALRSRSPRCEFSRC